MKLFVRTIFMVLLVSQSVFGFSPQIWRGQPPKANEAYPIGPHPVLTPGELCDTPSEHRYPEKIPYCTRDVATTTKKAIFAQYDHDLGFRTQKMQRSEFKIDHFFPLCAGGSNSQRNLWPQHKSVYAITDPLEPEVCGKMAEGRLKQEEAIQLVIKAKLNLEEAPEIIEYVRGL